MQYDENGQVRQVTIRGNEQVVSILRYDYDDAGHVARVVSEQPDGAIERTTQYRYDERGNVIAAMHTHPSQPNLDKTEITTYEYDSGGNWIRRTIVRAVNPVDDDGQVLEEAVDVTERKIVYGDRASTRWEPMLRLIATR